MMGQRCVYIQELVIDGLLGSERSWLSVHGVVLPSMLEEGRIDVALLTDLIAAALWPHTERRRIPEPPRCHKGMWRYGLTAFIEGRWFRILHDLKTRTVSLVRLDEKDAAPVEGSARVEELLAWVRTTPPPASDSDVECFAWLDNAVLPEPPPRGSSDTLCLAWLARAGLMVIGDPLRPDGVRRYVPLRLLRRDTFTRTDLAFDLHLQRHVWLRTLRTPWTEHAETRAAFLEMGILQARSEEHFVPIVDMDADEQGAWHVLSCDLVDAETLEPRYWRERGGVYHLISWINRCAALMNELGVAHGHLEPGHFVFEGSEARLSDPGIAAAIREAAPEALLRRFSPSPWAAPEVRAGERPGASSDIFSLGVMCEKVVSSMELEDDAPYLGGLEALIQRMVPRDPRERLSRWSDIELEV